MALAYRTLNHSNVSALTKGMRAGVSGVSAPPLQLVGSVGLIATPAANGSFSDVEGKGQKAYDSLGRMYICDSGSNRVQRFIKNSAGVWVYDSQCSSLSALGVSVNMEMVAIDRSRNQIHLASSSQNVAGTLVGVWNLASWPTLSVVNRVRSYGTASASNGAGNLRTPMGITLVGDEAILVSSAGDYRVIRYNHTTGAILAQKTNSLWKNRFASDGAKYYSGAQATDPEVGLWEMNPATLIGTTRLDIGSAGSAYSRRGYAVQGAGGGDVSDLTYFNGRLYIRLMSDGRILAWDLATNTFVDEFMWPGGTSLTENFGHAPGRMITQQIQKARFEFIGGDANNSDDVALWSSNAPNLQSQSFVTMVPVSIATATWSLTGWSAGVNTIKKLVPFGDNLAGEKIRLRLRKNAGAWQTVLFSQLNREDLFALVGTATGSDTIDIEASSSQWDRLDGHPVLAACRDKLPPTNMGFDVVYEDTASSGLVATPFAVNSFKAKAGLTPAFKAKIGG